MEQKKPGIPLVALIIFFALIISIIITCLIILSTRKTGNNDSSLKLSSEENSVQNAVVNNIEEPPVEEDLGTDIALTDNAVINAYKLTGNYDVAAKFAIYQNGNFTKDSMNETLKLKLALAQLGADEIVAGTISKARVEECLVKVFGTAENVAMQSVILFNDYNFKTEYSVLSFDYNEQEQAFTVTKSQFEGTDPSLVTEVVNKAISYNDRLEIYVTPIYVQVTDTTIEGATTKAYSLYSAYDFVNQTFSDLLIAVRKEDYYNAFVSGDTLDIDKFNYPNLSTNITNKRADGLDIATLQQYKYILTKSGDGYVLSGFEKVVPEGSNPTNTVQEQNTVDNNATSN